MLVNDSAYRELLGRVVEQIGDSRARALASVNSELVLLYWKVGAALNEHATWGSKAIPTLSHDIRVAFPGIKGFSPRNLRYMQKFAREFSEELCSNCCTIPWGHIMLLLDKTEPGERREWYVRQTLLSGWSRSTLDHHLATRLYERQELPEKVTNFDRMLPPADSEMTRQALKDPYVFDFITTREGQDERDIEEQMVTNVSKLLLELGTGFAFMGRRYHLVVGGEDFYIDLLFYNVRLHRYVVVELKNVDFKPEFLGKLSFYTAAIDGELKTEGDNPTIGLLLCKTKNDVVAEYSLGNIAAPIGVSEYRVGDELPEEYENILPSPRDLMSRI